MKRSEPEPSENGEARFRPEVKVGRLMRPDAGRSHSTPGSSAAAATAATAAASTSTGLPRPPPAALLGLSPTPKFRYVLKATPKMAGAIIGAKGATVTRLRQESGAVIHASEARGQEQDIEFGGTDEQIAKAVQLVKDVLAANNPPHPTDWTLKTLVTFTVPPHVVGPAIIGKGGKYVQAVRESSGANVDISALKDKDGEVDKDGRQLITIIGTHAQVASAYHALLDNINRLCPPPEGAPRARAGPAASGQRPQQQLPGSQRSPLEQAPGGSELDALAVAQAGAQRAQQIAMALAAGAAMPRPLLPLQAPVASAPAPYPLGAVPVAGMQPAAVPAAAATPPLVWPPPQNGSSAPAQVLFYNPADGSIKPMTITAEQATTAVAQHHLHALQQQAIIQSAQAQAQALGMAQLQAQAAPPLPQPQQVQQQQVQQQPVQQHVPQQQAHQQAQQQLAAQQQQASQQVRQDRGPPYTQQQQQQSSMPHQAPPPSQAQQQWQQQQWQQQAWQMPTAPGMPSQPAAMPAMPPQAAAVPSAAPTSQQAWPQWPQPQAAHQPQPQQQAQAPQAQQAQAAAWPGYYQAWPQTALPAGGPAATPAAAGGPAAAPAAMPAAYAATSALQGYGSAGMPVAGGAAAPAAGGYAARPPPRPPAGNVPGPRPPMMQAQQQQMQYWQR